MLAEPWIGELQPPGDGLVADRPVGPDRGVELVDADVFLPVCVERFRVALFEVPDACGLRLQFGCYLAGWSRVVDPAHEEAEAVIPEFVVPDAPTWNAPARTDGGILLSWSAPANAVAAGLLSHKVAAWPTALAEPAASADVTIEANGLDYTGRTIDPGCELRARIRAVGRTAPAATPASSRPASSGPSRRV